MGKDSVKLIANNKKAYFDYFIEQTYEAGISLHGTEVKSLRMGKCSVKEAFIRIENGEVFLYGMHISPYEKGNIFNMRLAPSTIATEESRKKIVSMMRAFFSKDGQQIQFNVTDNETLKAAQKNPEEYSDLMVRVSGYSALFTSLGESAQNDVINRTEVEL